uniref:Predicted protein n=1 Tax=Physcomitrium patens TaxID=3218 RepID=A9U5Y9_PHYPA
MAQRTEQPETESEPRNWTALGCPTKSGLILGSPVIELVLSLSVDSRYWNRMEHFVTASQYLHWNWPPLLTPKNLQAIELLREFERQYSQLSKVEKFTLEPNKVDLFLQAADGELQGKLELLLEDKEEDEGLTTKWKNVQDAVGLLTKRERRKDRSNIPKTIQAPKARKGEKIALKNREDLLQTNFGKGGMRALVQDYLIEHETPARESASYGAIIDDDFGGSTKTIHAYIAKSQYEPLMEEKRPGNFDDIREGNSFKRQTRGDKVREAASQELPAQDTSASLEEKIRETKDEGKSIAYKLLSDIEAATNLKGVLEERILNAMVEFTFKEVLEITKKMSHAIDARIYKDEKEVDIGYKKPTNEKNGYNQQVRFEDYSDKEMEILSYYTRKHWARATTEGTLFTINESLKGKNGGEGLDDVSQFWI